MMKVTKGMVFTHVQQYIREVYAERLRKAGFYSYKGEDIHWFRLVNNEVIHAVYFVADYPSFPVMLEIGYGCHPLFIPPILQHGPVMHPKPGYEQMHNIIRELIPGSMPHGVQRSLIHGLTNRIYRVPDVMVSCPADEHTSQCILQNVLSELEPINTPFDCYKAHKHWRNTQIESGSWMTMTTYFVDEVLYWEDEALYPYCMDYVSGKLEWLEGVQRMGKLTKKADRDELVQLQALKAVFLNEGRKKYVQELQDRKSKTLKCIQSQCP